MRAYVAAGLIVAALPSVRSGEDPLERNPRPNILWITAEDMSPNLGCYGDGYASTPRLDRFAEQSVRYTRAFATAPVCSPARSCLITGLYATSLGTQNLRSAFPIPAAFRGFPSYLRAAGYYCSNNVKTDYNTRNEAELIAASWDESSARAHWRNRRPGQPFFSVFNLMTTHQSRACVWSFEEFEANVGSQLEPARRHHPDAVPIPPYYPDTPLVRRTLARYYDCITVMDREAGSILDALEADGLADDTIVFFYSDHGMGLPRGKRTLYDSGMRVPLLVRFPERFRHLAPVDPGETTPRLVCFVDFPPTVLALAGAEIPSYMQGHPFLGGAVAAPRQYVYGARDRVDEAYDLSRSVRDDRYLYIRNYLPHLSLNQPEYYSDQAGIRREITALAKAGRLNRAQLTYAGPSKPPEELYDTLEDPHQIRNLVDSAAHRDVLGRLRAAHEKWLRDTRDLGLLPETELWRRASETPYNLGQQVGLWPPRPVLTAAGMVGRRDAVAEQVRMLRDRDAAVRFWAATGLRAVGSGAAAARSALANALEDEAACVRIEAAAALVELDDDPRALALLERELRSESVDAVLLASRALELLGDKALPARAAIARALEHASAQEAQGEHPCWMFVRFALAAWSETH